MDKRYSRSLRRWSITSLLVLVATLSFMLVSATGVLADQVRVFDRAGVLNQSQVQSETVTLGHPIDIYTINNFTGSTSTFKQATMQNIASSRSLPRISPSPRRRRHMTGSSDGGNSSTSGSGGGGLFAVLLLLILLGLVIFLVVRGLFRRRRGVPYQQPYNQGYPPNYGPGYDQGQGISPWVAGDLGAAGDGGDFGGDSGGGGGSDFGGGGGDFGGSGDSSGGGGGDSGSSGDSSGGGGSDFGGGGGDSGGGSF